MNKIRTRFAPSPTGKLHIGNARTALIAWLYARKNGGEFLLRFDDTDLVRTKQEYKDAIIKDLSWLGYNWDLFFMQSQRLARYEEVKQSLISDGRLYACFETPEELEIKRKLQLASGRPPIYDRMGLNLSQEQIKRYLTEGKKPHYRFFIQAKEISWHDLIKGELHYASEHLSDPIVIREDGTMTYMLCSAIDDIDYQITDVIRGEDHVTNTALQIDMFKALNANIPRFAHLSLIKAKEEKISKRIGGFEIESLRNELGYEAMAVNSFLANIGTSNQLVAHHNLKSLSDKFDIKHCSKSPTTYMPSELERINHKLLLDSSFNDVKNRLTEIGLEKIDEKFWSMIKNNLIVLKDIKDWWHILQDIDKVDKVDTDLIKIALKCLPEGDLDLESWNKWIANIKTMTDKRASELFMPLRRAITAMDKGPELRNIIAVIGRNQLIKRLSKYILD